MNSFKPPFGSWRVAIFLLTAGYFFLQTWFVYFDYPREGTAQELSAQAKEGLGLWRKNNCQACHQIYGFGGFLGPDLTNMIARAPDEDWTYILTEGRKQMPAYHFDERERAVMIAFLTEINETGTGVPRFTSLKDDVDVDYLVGDYLEATNRTAGEAVLRGEEQVRDKACNECHSQLAVEGQGANDLTLALSRRSPEYIRTILKEGKAVMPPFEFLTDEQVGDILAYLSWMRRNRRELGLFHSKKENGDTFNWAAVPWFEY